MVESPCIGVCAVRNSVCIGCGRTLQEIKSWLNMTDAEKTVILQRLAAATVVQKCH